MIFGNSDQFAVECELARVYPDWIYAHFRFWIKGFPVGDFEDDMHLRAGISWFRKFLEYTGKRQAPSLEGKNKEEVFAAIFDAAVLTVPQGLTLLEYLAIYQEPEDSISEEEQSRLRSWFHLDAVGMSAFMDKWNIILVENPDGSHRFIWRNLEDRRLYEAVLQPTAFEQATKSFLEWADQQGL